MIVPKHDFKIAQYKKTNLHEPIHVLSSTRLIKNLHNVNNEFITKKVVLCTCVEKEYLIAFMHKEFISEYKTSSRHPYIINTVNLHNLLEYCERHHQSLLILNDKNNLWLKIDPNRPYDVNVHKIILK